jgi:hypothetical protein
VQSVEFIHNHHVEWRGRRSFLLVSAHMQVLVIGAPIGQSVDQPWIAVEGENNGLVLGEQRIEVVIR